MYRDNRPSAPESRPSLSFFFFDPTATTEIYTLSLHDALPISRYPKHGSHGATPPRPRQRDGAGAVSGRSGRGSRSEEHTSELQSHHDLVCRLLLEKKKAME